MSGASSRPQLARRKVPSRRRHRVAAATDPQDLGPNSYRLYRLGTIAFALSAAALLLEALFVLPDQLHAFAGWHVGFLGLLLVVVLTLLFHGVLHRVHLWPFQLFAVVVALAVALLPAAWTGRMPAQSPWVEPFIVLGGTAAVISWGTAVAVGYLVVVVKFYLGVLLLGIRLPDRWTALLDGYSVLVFGVVIVVLIGLMLRAAKTADNVYAEAVAQRLELNRSRSESVEHERLDRLIHDNVMAALLDAGRSAGPLPDRTRELGRRALEVLALEEARAHGKGTTMVHTLLDDLLASLSPWRRRVRFSSITPYIRPPGEPRPVIPAETGQALVQAVTEAVSNSARHSGTDVTFVTMDGGACPPTPINPEGYFLRFRVVDRGRGFQLRTVDSRRLGVRVSIVGSVQQVGGAVEVDTAPGRGTRVCILWPRDAQP